MTNRMYKIAILLLLYTKTANSQLINFKNNVCDSYPAYRLQFSAQNRHCHVDETARMEIVSHLDKLPLKSTDLTLIYRTTKRSKHLKGERIQNGAGSAYFEHYNVTTSDGYILDVFRIRHDTPKGVIVLQHPLSGDARMWLMQQNESLALQYWRMGYDIWLPNNRGTRYGKRHTRNVKHFWDFSFHEMGVYDHPATFDLIRAKTGRKMIFIGHSMSVTSVMIYGALLPAQAAENLAVVIATAPVVYFGHMRGVFRFIADFYRVLELFNGVFRVRSIFDNDTALFKFLRWLDYVIPEKFVITLFECLASGWTPKELDPRLLVVVLDAMSGVSWKTIYHYCQLHISNRFRMYDYGFLKNLWVYRRFTPPDYPLGRINVPVYLYGSESDFFSTTKDIDTLTSKLPLEAQKYGKTIISGINHVDYHMGKDRWNKVWLPVINFINNNTF